MLALHILTHAHTPSQTNTLELVGHNRHFLVSSTQTLLVFVFNFILKKNLRYFSMSWNPVASISQSTYWSSASSHFMFYILPLWIGGHYNVLLQHHVSVLVQRLLTRNFFFFFWWETLWRILSKLIASGGVIKHQYIGKNIYVEAW